MFYRQVITDYALTAYQKYVVDWDNFNPAHLSIPKNTIKQIRPVVGFGEDKTLQMSIPLFSGNYTDTNTYTRSYQYDKIGNIQNLQHQANGHANQDFGRDYIYSSSNNKLKIFTVNSTQPM